MIKALLLIFFPVPTWERIVTAQRTVIFISLIHLLPLLLIGSAAEGYGMVRWGKLRGPLSHPEIFSAGHTIVYEIAQVILLGSLVFLLARLIKSLGDTFHGRHTFRQAFSVAAYGLSPFFLARIFDVIPNLSPWITWAAGLSLTAMILYQGLPRVMQPDPPHAFGLYLMTVLLLALVTGLVRFVTAWYLQGKFPALESLFVRLGSYLKF